MSDILQTEEQNSKTAIKLMEDQKSELYAKIAELNSEIQRIEDHLKLCRTIHERSDPTKVRQLRILISNMDLSNATREYSSLQRHIALRKYLNIDPTDSPEPFHLEDVVVNTNADGPAVETKEISMAEV